MYFGAALLAKVDEREMLTRGSRQIGFSFLRVERKSAQDPSPPPLNPPLAWQMIVPGGAIWRELLERARGS